MTRTLVTGAAGFTGRYLSQLLTERGHEVHGLVHDLEQDPVAGLAHTHQADLADLQSLENIISEIRPDYLVHLAAVSFVAHSDIGEMYRTNVVGTRQLLEAVSRAVGSITSVLVASSANIYGNSNEGVLDESVPPAPANDYGVSKVAMEYVARLYMARLPIIVVRPFNYTGRGQSESFLLPKIVAHARRKAPVIELGNLDVARDFSDVRTVAETYAQLLTARDAIGETFNVCSGRAVSLRSVLDIVGRISAHPMEVKVNPQFVRANEVRSLCGSSEKLQRVIGAVDAIPLEETLRWMLQD
jgi:nucleoside-diphosphate-sugar epimerase